MNSELNEKLPTRKNLINWYNVNKKLPMDSLNKFWLRWEKTWLLAKRAKKQSH